MSLSYPKAAGIVKKFSGMGRKLGYPTANIELAVEIPDGLYVGYTVVSSQLSVVSVQQQDKLKTENRQLKTEKLPSIVYVGAPETFNLTKRRIESHILDFPDEDLYGQHIEVQILDKIRDNRHFDSIQNLITQMQKDEAHAREYFKKMQVK